MRRVLVTILLLLSCFAVNGQIVHTVKRGEALGSIASLYHASIECLKGINENTEIFSPGLLLTIPQNRKVSQPKHKDQKEAFQLDKVKMKATTLLNFYSFQYRTVKKKQERGDRLTEDDYDLMNSVEC
jgi:hypothetical protein